MVKAAINGFGRIGRITLRVWLKRMDLQEQLDVVAINTSGSMPVSGWAHLLKYDTAYGPLEDEVQMQEVNQPEAVTDKNPLLGYFIVKEKKIPLLAQKDPAKLPWETYQVDVAIESTGVFTSKELASAHLRAGARKVLISAPSKGEGVGTFVLGVNQYRGEGDIIDNASCTTNCVAPVVAVLNENFGVRKASLTTIHAYTDDQRLQDNSHKDLRRARAASQNIIPTTTGAAIATTKTIPDIRGMFDGIAIRVPVNVGSISDVVCLVNRKVTVDEVKRAFQEAAKTRFKNIIAVTDEPLVSSDIIGRSESAIVDLPFTQVIDGDLVKILAWYDNEWGYSNRLLEQAVKVGETQ
ncbi:MAG: type I glyceraldehyde-3-phosphate dehydrogenase [Candidatus Chisholmbacteria bacterium RIFCSPLOWO2_01_FULL_50_28]|uniref:Type I glyceraldehyde-3-phosphate dehydrogenase n=1 Tax=Candidatus Chisholmbacteria bacterium RIFCSPHIGHO2_01_FULL_52_32 TaxID=1797591 RepID=A0A1G1VUW7_9BACT|nr:MAG: type I glyceraldehyde-3-phosphate dehydrogenase [Candidatus Chisholmbacteria bacterium RIFCSPHIGHO2_01_FULL_52_32]OGY19689.1 MAG: type I glyceraldehyde-3-phosphate dehydrogenase [Candidatus Chisholmbacteria bacterium RIFCSPLOWO2_01_FULL_50_28]